MQQGIPSPRKTGPARFLLIAAVLLVTLLVSSMLWAAHITPFTQLAEPVNPIVTGQTVPSSPPGIYLAKPGEISRLDAQTRKVIWHTGIPAKVAVMNKDAGEPVVIDSTVYLIEGNTVLAFDANKGVFRWSNKFDANVGNLSIVNGVLYVSPFRAVGGKLYGLDPSNGKIKATYTSPLGMWNPTVVNGVVYYASGSIFYAQRLADKKPLWYQQVGAGRSLELVSVKDGIAYASAMVTAPPKGESPGGLFYAFDVKTGKQLWKSSNVSFVITDFIVTKDAIYCVSADGDLNAFDSHTGKHIWSLQADAYGLQVNAGVLYVHYGMKKTSGGEGIEALQAKDGKKLWQASFTGRSYHGPIGLQRGVIYMMADDGTTGSIDAFNANTGAQVWHQSITGKAAATVA